MHKKAQGISMETIVIAVIVLFVLAILLLVFTGRINIFGIGLKECSTMQGQCFSTPCGTEGANSANRATLYGGKCSLPNGQPDTSNPYCCSIVQSSKTA